MRHGFVERAVDWPYSSIHRDIARGIVEPEWSGFVPGGEFGGVDEVRPENGPVDRFQHRTGDAQGVKPTSVVGLERAEWWVGTHPTAC